MLRKFLKAVSGSTAIEYSIIAGLISIAIVAGVTNLGTGTGELYETVNEEISNSG